MRNSGWHASRLSSAPDRWARCRVAAKAAVSRAMSHHSRSTGTWHSAGLIAKGATPPDARRRRSMRGRDGNGRVLPVALLAALGPFLGSHAQAPAPVPYRAPSIALVQPPAGGTVPQDRPVIVLRFARGEAADPVDVRTFAVAVDGVDRTAHFQVTADEAWGPLSKIESTDSLIALGHHAVVARVCSVRGACGEAATVLVIAAPAAVTGPQASPSQTRSTRTRVIALLLDAVRRLIVP
jgi:hypothetical protein